MVAEHPDVWLVNIYAPPGAEKKQTREEFFNINIPHLLRAIPTAMIVGGDVNCVLARTDCTGHFNYSRALNDLLRGCDLVDAWATAPERGIYTHYTWQEGISLDKIYVTRNISSRKSGAETAVKAFADHLAVILRITWTCPLHAEVQATGK
jgi:endonuclease/exonuclease/phosphatase family metal-dependent hydrolase